MIDAAVESRLGQLARQGKKYIDCYYKDPPKIKICECGRRAIPGRHNCYDCKERERLARIVR